MSAQPRTDAAFFEQMYADAPGQDPWSFETSDYEQSRYRTVMAALPSRHFRACLEPGCSIGVLSVLLARRCDHLLALDVSRTAVDRARTRATDAGCTNVEFREGAFPESVGKSDAPFDLLCLVEVGYYFSAPRLRQVLRSVDGVLDRSATVLASHWTGHSDDHVITGDEVHDVLVDELAELGFRHEVSQRPVGFHLDGWERS